MGRIVIVCYRPKAGKLQALRRMIGDHVPLLRAQKLVTERAAIIMEAKDGTIVEVFEWISAEAIAAAHTHPAVLAMWNEYSEVCDYIPIGEVPEAAAMFSEFTPLGGARPTPPARHDPPVPPGPPVMPGKRRNEFGDPIDTVYAGGTPLFDETGGLGGRSEGPGKRRR